MKHFFDDLSKPLRDVLLSQIRGLWTHHSTALEGNSLTLGETQFILDEGLTIAGKPLKDHIEVVGHAKAIDLILEALDDPKFLAGTGEEFLFALHRAVQTETVMDIMNPIGAWKVEPNYTNITAADGRQQILEYPVPAKIPRLMQQWIKSLEAAMHAAPHSQQAAKSVYAGLHFEFVTVHPFADGNGRMARLLANMPVLASGLPPIVIPMSRRSDYIKALQQHRDELISPIELKQLNNLEVLRKDVPSRKHFETFCAASWNETLRLVNEARALNQEAKTRMQAPPSPRR